MTNVLPPKITTENMPIHLDYLIKKVDKIDSCLEKDYISRQEFEPIRKIVYGMISLILIAVFGALLALVIK